MKKKIMIFVIIVFFIIVAIISGISKHNNDIKNKENENKRYAEIKNSVKKAVELKTHKIIKIIVQYHINFI